MTSAALAEPKRFALGASPECRTVTVDGVSIAYDDRGDGFPVIGLHAITHGSRDFEHVAGRLASRWRFITPDWPGQGRWAPMRIRRVSLATRPFSPDSWMRSRSTAPS